MPRKGLQHKEHNKQNVMVSVDRNEYYRWQRDRNREITKIRNKNIVDDIKGRLCCMECGERDPRCIDFHHRDPGTKSKDSGGKTLGIANLASGGYSLNRIFEELEKCDPLCANCHRKYHG